MIGRKKELCFFSNLSMVENYGYFGNNIGGELARRALKDQYNDLYNPLEENRESFVVKFKMPFSNIVHYGKVDIAYRFVLYYASKHLWGKEYEIEFEGNTEVDIKSERVFSKLYVRWKNPTF